MSIWKKSTYRPDEWIKFQEGTKKTKVYGRPRKDYSSRMIITSVKLAWPDIFKLDEKVEDGIFASRSEAIRYYIKQGLSNTD